jgi:ComF family protein
MSGLRWRASACALCASASDAAVCEACDADLPRIRHACPRCARPMPRDEVCGRCLRKPPAFDAALAVFAYQFPIDGLVQRAKFNADFATLAFLSAALSQRLKPIQCDGVVPVPLAPARQRERGYNQAALLAKAPAAMLNVPLFDDLMRTRETEKQTELSFKARLRNVREAFSAASLERPLAGKHVVLIDDVMTTGATLHEAAKALKAAGATRVTAALVARVVARTTLN